ncbi:MAG: hypothetical protein FIA99_19170 [Ruminiclostridium sp.]|nr:hypothetical protein [Ruminiclostridium sp.]
MLKLKKFLSIILIYSFLFTSIFIMPASAYAADDKNAGQEIEVSKVKQEILVRLKSNDKLDEIKNAVKSTLNIKKLELKKSFKSKLNLLEIDSQDDINNVIEELKKYPDVEYAHPNYELRTLGEEAPSGNTVPLYEKGQITEGQEYIPGKAVNQLPAWEITKGSPNVIVGVLDTGIDISHKELSANIYVNTGEIPDNGKDDDGNGYIDDITGWDFVNNDNSVNDTPAENHATHIAGIIAAKEDGEGISGIAPEIRILPLKFINGNIGNTSDAIEAIEYAQSMGVKIINCSWGGYDYNTALRDVMAGSDILFISSAGNDGTSASVYPAGFNLPNIISVAAVDNTGSIAAFSNYGWGVDIAAPGVDVLSTAPQNQYGYQSGTSVAAPFVTGVAALIKAYDSEISSSDIAMAVKGNAAVLAGLQGKVASNGIVDAYAALNSVKNDSAEEMKAKTNPPEMSEYEKERTKKVLDTIKNNMKYSKMSDGDKLLLKEYYKLQDDLLLEGENRGYSLVESISIALISIKYGFTPDEIQKLFARYENIQEVSLELSKLRYLKSMYAFTDSESVEVKDLLLEGNKIKEIRLAFIASRALGISIKEIIKKAGIEEDDINSLDSSYTEKEKTKLAKLKEHYSIDINKILKYAKDKKLSIEEVYDKIINYQVESGDNVSTLSEPEEVIYDKYITAPYSYRNNNSENININTGNLTYESADLVLSGINGLDLRIVSRYESDKTNLYEASYRVESVYHPDYDYDYDVWSGATAYWVNWIGEGRYPEGDIPYASRGVYEYLSDAINVEAFWEADTYWYGTASDENGYWPDGTDLKKIWTAEIYEVLDYDNSYYTYNYINETKPNTYEKLHNNLGSGWSLGFSSIEIESSGAKFLHIGDGRAYKINITSTAGDSNLDKYTLCDIRLENDTGSYSNGVKSSQYVLYYKDGKKEYFADDGRLLGIRDRFGNTIKFEHTTINGHAVINKITDTVSRVVNISYETIASGKKVTVTAPGGATIQYMLEPITGYSGEYKLVKKIDQLNRETTFNYQTGIGNFSFFSKSSRTTQNVYANLTEVHYPTGAYSKYTYETATGNLGNQGSYDYYRVKTREENDNSVIYNKDTYNYNGNNTGFPTYSDPNSLPGSFSYGTTIVDNENNYTVYTFNNNHLGTREENKINGTTLFSSVDTEYDANKLPVKKVGKNYNSAGQYITKVENYAYDTGNFGDLTGYWDSQAQRDTNNMPTDGNEHKTIFSYNPSYHYIVSKSYKKDAAATILEENTPSTDNKTISLSKIKENNIVKAQTGYVYDTFGNVIEEHKYLDDFTNYIAQKYSYTDNVPSRNGQLNGAYLTRKWIEGVKDADNALVTAKSGNNAGIIDEIYKYDLLVRIEEKSDGTGNPTTYQYDALGRVLRETHLDSTYKSYSYNDSENSITVTDENGKALKYDYTGLGNLSYEMDLTGGYTIKNYTYDNKLRTKTETANSLYNNTSTTEHFYLTDGSGRISRKEIRNNSGAVIYAENLSYDDAFNNGQYAKITKTIVGDANSPSIVTNTYINKYGQVDKQGRMCNTTEYLDTFKYDYLGNKTEEKSARAYDEGWSQLWTTKYDYNYAGKTVKVTNIQGEYTTTEYDALGRVKKVTDQKGNLANPIYSTEFIYDNLGRVIEEKVPFENVSGTVYFTIKRHYYDRNGNVTLEKTSKNKPGQALSFNQTEYGYNSRNMLTSVKTFDAGSPENYTQYYYDSVGNKLRMYTGLSAPLTINGLDNITPSSDTDYSVTKYEYDRLNRLITMTDPLNKPETYSYDLNGNMVQKTDRNGSIISMTYDGLNRLLANSVTNTGMPGYNSSITYSYTLTGNRLSISGGNSSSSYLYDSLGRLITETEGQITKEYTYDAANNRKTLIIKQNSQVKESTSYTYDNLNRLYQVSENGQLTATYAYDSNGNRQTLTYSNGDSTDYTYNLANKLKTMTNKKGTTVLSSYSYEYSLDGNQVKKTDNTGKVTDYIYDGLGRLSNEAATGENAVSYTYDDSNNREIMTVAGGAATTYDYDKNNRLNAESKVTGTVTEITTYKYDGNGNQIYKGLEIIKPIAAAEGEGISAFVLGESTDDAGVAISGYDGFNRLIKVATGNAAVAYTYNGDGLRISKTVNGATSKHVWDGDQIALELNGAGAVTNKYVRGINLIYSEDGSGNNRKFYMYNGHSDVVQLTNTTGDVVKSYDYDAFGVEKNIDPNDTQVFRYTGEYYDRETATIYLRSRYYSPSIGRFISEDSFLGKDSDPLSLNLYTYCYNDPIDRFDPSGHVTFKIGNPTAPTQEFDEYFKYDPNAKATWGDRASWVKWGAMSLGGKLFKNMPDAVKAYNHYRSGSGTDMKIDYEKAYKQDADIKSSIDALLGIAQDQAVSLQKSSGMTSFDITSDLYGIQNGATENWQKTIGAHYVWSSASVTFENGQYTMKITVHMKDLYNFNKGMADIASGTPDDVNGRFAVLGWAKSFYTVGELNRTITWGGTPTPSPEPDKKKR